MRGGVEGKGEKINEGDETSGEAAARLVANLLSLLVLSSGLPVAAAAAAALVAIPVVEPVSA
jgi:hypothetical protein